MNDPRDHARYTEWDAAYVLGSLSSVERREFEAHLELCDRCRLAVADLSGLPSLLGRVVPERALSLLASEDEDEDADADEDAEPGSAPVTDIVARIEKAEHRRRLRRFGIVGGIAAAALAVAAVAIPVTIAAQPHPTVAVALAPTAGNSVSGDVQLTSVKWGTKIDMHCAYGTGSTWGYPGDGGYALWVVDRAGRASEVSTWKATSGSQVKLTAATALSVGEIARIEVRSAATNDVLLAKKL
jgi:hypothetical protein